MTGAHPSSPGVRISVRAKPRASRSRVLRAESAETGSSAGAAALSVEVALASPPVDGAANAELLRLLADVLALPKSSLRLVVGKASRHKVVEVSGLAADEVARRLALALD